jgi:hypothetical protein
VSLYQCEHCGCCENTALGCYWSAKVDPELFDWTGIEDRRGKYLCSACGPRAYAKGQRVRDEGQPTGYGKWHGRFERVFLPRGMFRTNARGNLEHIETGSEDFRAYAVSPRDV